MRRLAFLALGTALSFAWLPPLNATLPSASDTPARTGAPQVAQPSARASAGFADGAAVRLGGPGLSVSLGAPSPTAAVVAAQPSASAVSVSGIASWHATGRDGPYAAAGPALRVGDWRGRVVTVTGPAGTIELTLNDACACPERLIDLSDEAFLAICGPLSLGLCSVTVGP